MAERQLDDVFGIRPVPKRHKSGNLRVRPAWVKEAESLHLAPEGRICIYIIGPDDERVSKIGVSRAPYRRMVELKDWQGKQLRMCFFAEMARAEGFAVEAAYHRIRRANGETVMGEWVSVPRQIITKQISEIIRDLGITPSHQAGDTGDAGIGADASNHWFKRDGLAVPINMSGRRRLNG